MMLGDLRDYREPRRWDRVWRDLPGFFQGNCPCCSSTPTTYGYTWAGISSVSSPAGLATCDKHNYSAETTAAATSGNLTSVKEAAASLSNATTAGYIAGGVSSSSSTTYLTTCDKITFSGDSTAAATTANLSQGRAQLTALSERSTKGYYCGGGTNNAGLLTAVKTTDKLTFSGDTTAAQTTADLSGVKKLPAGMSEGTSKGYIAGGYSGSPNVYLATADKLTFSSDATAAQTSANLTAARQGLFAGSDGSTKGYWAGGATAATVTTVEKLTFSTDVAASLTSASLNRQRGSSGSNGTIAVFMNGDFTDASGSKATFATDVFATFGSGSAGNLSVARILDCGCAQAGL